MFFNAVSKQNIKGQREMRGYLQLGRKKNLKGNTALEPGKICGIAKRENLAKVLFYPQKKLKGYYWEKYSKFHTQSVTIGLNVVCTFKIT
jgi:hypothetical protein